MNKVSIIGYIQDEAFEPRTTAKGNSVLNFTIRHRRDKDHSDFIDCTAWKSTADFICKYFKKGDPIIVHGKLATSVFEKNGEKRKKVFIEVTEVEFCPTKKDDNVVSIEPEEPAKENFEVVDDEDIPF